MSSEKSICPYCGGDLIHRDWKPRIMKWYDGEAKHLLICRLKCRKCDRLHNELPDILTPHKHYAAEVIENVVDGVSTSEDPTMLLYPCGGDWREHQVSADQIYRRHNQTRRGSETLFEVSDTIIQDNIRKGNIRKESIYLNFSGKLH